MKKIVMREGVMQNKKNIILIGMPGAGKSTVGIVLAKKMSMDFIDTDVLIQLKEGRSLQEIVDHDGYLVLRSIEEQVLLGLLCTNSVIATGGSAVYSDLAMRSLRNNAFCIFLDVPCEVLLSRVRNYATRGLAKRSDQSFAELFVERYDLYRKYADLIIDCSCLSQDEVCDEIEKHYFKKNTIQLQPKAQR
jgi:shikimate kinase